MRRLLSSLQVVEDASLAFSAKQACRRILPSMSDLPHVPKERAQHQLAGEYGDRQTDWQYQLA